MKDAPTKPRILVADDEYSNVEIILSIISDTVDQVYYAPNGKIAVELALEESPDIILMDWQMPEMDGIEAIKKIKSYDQIKDIPIIVTTGIKISDENLKEALDSGANDFLKKPYSAIEFQARVKSALRVKMQHETIKNMLEQEKQYIQEALDLKQRELTSMAVFDLQKNSLLNDLLEQINRLDRITNYVYATNIKSIQKDLQAQLDLGKSWDSFKVHFEKTHNGFFDRLDKEYPDISLSERKLSAYVKMGMGNFEICEMTRSTDTSIRKAINRLKKKLNLGAKDDVRKFFFEF